MIRKDFNDQIFRTEKEKKILQIKKIIECHEKGQPLFWYLHQVSTNLRCIQNY